MHFFFEVNCGDHCLYNTFVLIHRTNWKASKDISTVTKIVVYEVWGISCESVIL